MLSLTLDVSGLHPAVVVGMAFAILFPWIASAAWPFVRMWREAPEESHGTP